MARRVANAGQEFAVLESSDMTWALDASRIAAAPFDLPFAAMREQQELRPIPLLTLRQQAGFWAEDLHLPRRAAQSWLICAGVGKKWRELSSNPEARDAFDARVSWRPSPALWTNFSVVPSGFLADADSPHDALTRAARLALAAQRVHADFMDRRLKPECAGNHHLDLSQMANVFRGVGVFDLKPRWCYPPPGPSYFCVFFRGRPCFLPMPSAAEDVQAVRAALAAIVSDGRGPNESSLAPLSALGIDGLRAAGLDKAEDVRLLVNAIGAARFVLCLDLESAPEDEPRAGYLTQVSFANRWYLHG